MQINKMLSGVWCFGRGGFDSFPPLPFQALVSAPRSMHVCPTYSSRRNHSQTLPLIDIAIIAYRDDGFLSCLLSVGPPVLSLVNPDFPGKILQGTLL